IKIPVDVFGVVLVGHRSVDVAQLQGDDPQPLGLEPTQDLPQQTTTKGIGLEKDQGALTRFGHARSLPRPSIRTQFASAAAFSRSILPPNAYDAHHRARKIAPRPNITGTMK